MSDKSVKNRNLGNIYRTIYYDKRSSRQIIADKLGLSLPTVTNNLNRLKEISLIQNAGSLESSGGRKPNALECVPDARYALGVDITKNHLSIVIIDLKINLIASQRIRCAFRDTDDYYSNIADKIEQMLDEREIPREKVLGVGVSMPAIINEDKKTVFYLTVIHVKDGVYERIAKHIPYPCLLFNDANSAGLAESWVSESKKNMVYLSLSNSVGGATMNGNMISEGSNFHASEFGHICIVPNGRKCYCGQRGCLDAYCSANLLSDFTDGNLKKFFDDMEGNEENPNGNAGYKYAFEIYLDHLAYGVNNLRMCYDCDVVLGGYVGAYMGNYIERLREKAMALNPFESDGGFIRVCHYRTEASAVGAAIYYINQFVQNV